MSGQATQAQAKTQPARPETESGKGAGALALLKRDTVDVVAERVRQYQERRELDLPAGYSAPNALKSAWLTLQSVTDRNGKPALAVCTRDSIANSLLDMVVQGLNPSKRQGYFIAYGQQLAFQRSYFGTMAVCKQVAGAREIYAQVVYQGDEFEYSLERGQKKVTRHDQKIENVKADSIAAAYCVVEYADGRTVTDIMTWEQIQQSWKKSKMNPQAADSTHRQFPEQMALRTVINRCCKPIINSSSDNHLFLESFHRAEEIADDAEIDAEIAAHANGEVIDVAPVTPEDDGWPAGEPEAPAPNGQSCNQTASTAEQQSLVSQQQGPGF